MKIYLAGPLFTAAERAFNVRLKELLQAAGHEVWLPQENEPRNRTARDIFLKDVEGIQWADVVVANMDGPDPDSGTCWEAGYAYRKRPIVAFRTDFRLADDPKIAPYNLMLTESSTKSVYAPLATLDEIASRITAALEELNRDVCPSSEIGETPAAQNAFMSTVMKLSKENVRDGKGGPFAAVVVKEGKLLGSGTNRVTSANDPTAHAEIVAIREACRELADFRLTGCQIYTTCEPCPMCMGALYWARPAKVFYAATRRDAADIGFDDALIYGQLALPVSERSLPMQQMMREDALKVFQYWERKPDKVNY
jgi:guanine deaminase